MKDILISGYYGFGNSGDDALLSCIIDDICKFTDRSNIAVLTANPEETARVYGVRTIDRMNIISIAAAMTHSKLLISGGGTLMQDGTSTKSLIYYLGIIFLAQLFGLKTMLYANGIGPLVRDKNKKRTKKILSKVDMITLRDMRSKEVLDEIGVKNPNIHVTADPVFGVDGVTPEFGKNLLKKLGIPEGTRCIGISVRGRKGASEAFIDETAAAVNAAIEKYGLFPVIIPMQHSKDMEICKNLAGKLSSKSIIIEEKLSIYEAFSLVSCMELCIGMRLHMLIYAAAMCVPVIGLVYDPKVSGFMQYTGQKFYIDVDSVTKQELVSLTDEIMDNYDKIKKDIFEAHSKMRELTAHNAKYLKELIEK